MPRRDDVPQTVGDAADFGWEWLRAKCGYCGRSKRVYLDARPRDERLGDLARRIKCKRCAGHARLFDYAMGAATGVREKMIAFEGPTARRVGMG